MRPGPVPWRESPAPPVRPCTPLSDSTSSGIAPSEVELSITEPNSPESPPISPQQSGRSKDVKKFKWVGKMKQESLIPEGNLEDGHAPNLAILDMQLTRPSSVTTDHSRQRFAVLFKSMKMWPTRMSHESIQHMLTEPTDQVAATEGEFIAPRHKLDTAYIEGTFDRIEYGQFRSRPAVFICIDMILKYQPTNIIKAAELKFQFGPAKAQSLSSSNTAQNPTTPPTSLVSNFFAPDELQGIPASSHITRHSHIKPKFAALSVHADVGGVGKQIADTEQHCWHVQGRVDEHDGGIRDTFRWTIFENGKSKNSVPRRVRLGMIAFHERKPFYVDVSVDGSTKNRKHSRPTPTREKRWFYPPKFQGVGEYVLDEKTLQDYIRLENDGIPDVAPHGAMERLRGGDQIQMTNNRMSSGGVGRDIAGAAGDTFSLVGNIGGFLDLNTAAADMISLRDVVGAL